MFKDTLLTVIVEVIKTTGTVPSVTTIDFFKSKWTLNHDKLSYIKQSLLSLQLCPCHAPISPSSLPLKRPWIGKKEEGKVSPIYSEPEH